MTLEEYLHTSFEGECEYLDGKVVERNCGTFSHGRTLGEFLFHLHSAELRSRLFVCPILRLRVSETRIRVPDVAVFAEEPEEQVPSIPPLIAIEVLSPEDKFGPIMSKIEEFGRWGVKHVWLADPEVRKFFTYEQARLREVSEFVLEEYDIRLSPTDIFGDAKTEE